MSRPGDRGRPPAFPAGSRALLAVAAGGLVGSALRSGLGRLLGAAAGWPWATLLVNLVGAFLLGGYLARRTRAVTRPWSLEVWAVGALGSLTTFSGLSYEVFVLLEARRPLVGALYAAISILGGVVAAFAGEAVGGAGR